jgi:prephenate dehydratase
VSNRVAYLGPAGTFTEDALRRAARGTSFDPWATGTIYEAILAVERGEADQAFVPFENSIEGAVRSTLDTLALEAEAVTIVGEFDYPIRISLIARGELAPARISAVLSHPQASAQCARYLREQLPEAEVRETASTADAVRTVSESDQPWAALGARASAELYGCVALAEGVEDSHDNVTRFVWIAPQGTEPQGGGPWKSSRGLAELGQDQTRAPIEALLEFSQRGVNLTRIESRPRRQGLGTYMFFVDLEGSTADPEVAAAIEGLRRKAESVRLLGSYPTG